MYLTWQDYTDSPTPGGFGKTSQILCTAMQCTVTPVIMLNTQTVHSLPLLVKMVRQEIGLAT